MEQPLRYPFEAFTDSTDYLQIQAVEYIPIKNLNSTSSLVSTPGSRRNSNTKLSGPAIYLPIPSNVVDGNSVDYSTSNLNSIAGAAVGGVMKIMKEGEAFTEGGKLDVGKGLEQMGKGINDALNETSAAAGGLEGIAGFLTRQAASSAVNIFGANISPNEILSRQTGEILNPNLELLFGGPTLRSFRFTFQMVARSNAEGLEIKKIIRKLKKDMAPITKNTTIQNTTLKTPRVFELRYKQGASDHSFLHRFKQCFLTDISVNYTAEGTYATYEDGTPVSIKMDLTFKEIEPIYDVDYDSQQGQGGVGY